MRTFFFGESVFYVSASRHNPNIEMPPEGQPFPSPPDREHGPPDTTPPDAPTRREDEPDPPPIREPGPNEPTRLI